MKRRNVRWVSKRKDTKAELKVEIRAEVAEEESTTKDIGKK